MAKTFDAEHKAMTLRFEEGVWQELDQLSEFTQISKNQLINGLIRQEYNTVIDGDPKVREAIEKLNLFKKMLEELNETK